MRKTLIVLVIAFAAGAAQAQIQCWNDGNGKRVCGDTPPPGAKVTTVRGTATPSGPEPAPSGAAQKDAKKSGPLTPAEQEQEYRKRKLEEQQAAEKSEKDRLDRVAKRENCERARESLRSLESGQRMVRVDSKGERFYLDDAQIAQEKSRARELVQQSCN